MKIKPDIFRAYDIRGRYPKEINPEIDVQAVKAYLDFLKPKSVAVGRDIRKSSKEIFPKVLDAIREQGVKVYNVGEISTEMLYFAVNHLKADGGLAITASHNPGGWAGIKMTREKAIPLSGDTGIKEIGKLARKKNFKAVVKKGGIVKKDISRPYYQKLARLVDYSNVNPLKVVINPLNGIVGKVIRPVLDELPLETVKIDFEPKESFPKGQPDPLIKKRQKETSQAVLDNEADLGVSFDGDGDRCFFFDEKGQFISSAYIVAFLGQHLVKKSAEKNPKVIIDPRLVWAIKDRVEKAGAQAIETKVGHSFFKERMRKESALFAGEITGHFYYRDFYKVDSGLLTLLYFLELISKKDKPVSKIVQPLKKEHPVILETNFKIEDKEGLMKKVEKKYEKGEISHIDGVSIAFDSWRFNIRPSNTSPVIRLNLEALDRKTLKQKRQELVDYLKSQGATRTD